MSRLSCPRAQRGRDRGLTSHSASTSWPWCDRGSAGSARAPILGLFLRRRPPTVARFVVAVVVDALDAVSIRPLAHVGEEVLEDLPALADGDAGAAVMLVVRCPWVRRAAFSHRLPRFVGRRSAGFA